MKYLWLLAAATFAGAPAFAAAGTPPDRSAGAQVRRQEPTASERADAQRRLQQAQQALQRAAEQVASLSLQMFGHEFRSGLRSMNAGFGWARLGLNLDGGSVVRAVTPGGPADRAGLRAGDTLRSINGIAIGGDRSRAKLVTLLGDLQAGQQVTLQYTHAGKSRRAELSAEDPFAAARRLAERTGRAAALHARFAARQGAMAARAVAHDLRHQLGGGAFFFAWPSRWSDMQLARLTPRLGAYFGTAKGLLVVRAPDNDTLRLKDGDVILDIGGRVPRNPMQAVRILRSYAPGETVKLDIMRDRHRQELKITLPREGNPPPSPPSPPRGQRGG